MAEFSLLIFAADNLTNPQNPGFLPAEDGTFRSDLVNGDQITWNGGGETAFITIDDPTGSTFDEAQSNQTLVDPVTFDGVSYGTGQVVTPTYTIVFNGSDGNSYTLTSFNFSPNTNNEIPDAVFWEDAIPPAGTVLTVTSEINPTGGNARDYNTFVTCFCAGTLIETQKGPKPVESLSPKDRIATQSGAFVPVLRVYSRRITLAELTAHPNLRPVVIRQGAMGQGVPHRDLRVSRQHRLAVTSPICKRMFGTDQALVAAIRMTKLSGIYVEDQTADIVYYHVMLENHEVIYAEGAPAESLYLGKAALQSLPKAALEEIPAIFPDLRSGHLAPKPAGHIPLGKRQKTLIARHAKTGKPLLMTR